MPTTLALAVTGAFAALVACGTDPVGVDACRRVERVRCESAPACGIDLSRPVHNGDSDVSAVAACIRFYDDACLHGLPRTEAPSNMETQACIDAILNDSCDVVRAPETHPACAFLIPDPAASAPPPDQAAPDSGLATPDATVVFDAAPVFDAGR